MLIQIEDTMLQEKKNILVVEDEMIVALDIEHQLQSNGYRTFNHAASYEEAVGKINKINPDLVLLDIRLKDGSSGFRIADYAGRKGIPVIFITASTHISDYRKAQSYRPAAIIPKPVDEFLLKESINRVLY
jgi:two-component system, sensor histidine kinase